MMASSSLSPTDDKAIITFNSCPDRFKWELRPSYPLFSLEEPSGRFIHVQECFAPRRRWGATAIARLLMLGWTAQVLYDDIVYTYPRHNLWIYLGYLTHWGHVITILYFVCSLFCCLVPSSLLEQPKMGNVQPRALIKWTWGLYSLVAPLELAITILYWGSGIAGRATYSSIMEHGVLGTLVWIDGIFVGNVPVRAKHVIFLITTAALYLSWTIVNALLGIGNGEWGPAYNDDALYPVLNWNKQTHAAAILSAFVVVILAPALFYLCWLASLLSPRAVPKSMTEEEAVEEGSRCCCHGCCDSCCCLVCDGSRRPLYDGENASNVKTQEGFDYRGMDKGVMA